MESDEAITLHFRFDIVCLLCLIWYGVVFFIWIEFGKYNSQRCKTSGNLWKWHYLAWLDPKPQNAQNPFWNICPNLVLFVTSLPLDPCRYGQALHSICFRKWNSRSLTSLNSMSVELCSDDSAYTCDFHNKAALLSLILFWFWSTGAYMIYPCNPSIIV